MNRSKNISLLGFVPALVVQYLSENKKVVQLPDKQTFKSVVMFADISGFTNLTETLHKLGHEGCELTAFAINRYMELLVKAISRSGGDIFKFAGDAMIVVWPPPDSEGKTSLETLCRQAIQSALDIQAKLHDTYILKNIKLSVKIGFGIGEISIVYTGGIFGRCEYLASGDPLTQAFNSEHHAKAGGETLISKELFDEVKDFFDFEENPADNPECYHVVGVKEKVRMKADALIIKNNLDMLKFEKVRPQLLGYIPAALLPYIDEGQESWGNELRNLTIMFLNLGVDLSCTSSAEGMQRIQKVIQTVQKCIYMHEGSLNKLLMDDKGSTLIVVFGLPPMCHQDDAARAIMTAFLLQKELKKLQCGVSIGIATGKVFAGVVGTSGSRREYSVLGDEVNLSARLMQLACSEKKEKIILCGTTKEQSSGAITSVFFKDANLKGKAHAVKIYVPLESAQEQKENPILAMIKIHQEASLLIYEDIAHHKIIRLSDDVKMINQINQQEGISITPPQPMIGNEKNIQLALQSFISLLSGQIDRQLLVLRGAFGVGKSHLLKICLAQITDMIKQGIFGDFKFNENPHIIVTVINPVDRNLKMNGLRITIRALLDIIAKRNKIRIDESFLKDFFQPIRDSKLCLNIKAHEEYFKEFLSLINPPLEPIQNFPSPISEPQKLEMKALNAYINFLFSAYLESEIIDRRVSVMNNNKQQTQEVFTLAPLVLVFPNCEHFDQATFKALRHIIKRYPKIMIVLLQRDNQTEIPMVGNKSQEQISEMVGDGVYRMMEGLDQSEIVEIHMDNLKRQGLNKSEEADEYKKFIKQLFGIDEFRETFDLSKIQQVIEDDQESIYDQRQAQKKQRLKEQIQNIREKSIRQKMRDHLLFYEGKHDLININFSEYVFHFLYLKTKGHALATKQWLNMLIKKNMLIIEGNCATVSIELRKIFEHEEVIILDVPFIYGQINGQIIDKLACFKSLILKSASVIGDMFDLNTLAKIHPFQQNVNNEKLIKELDDLEQKGIIEIMESEEDNILYRFTFPFFREAIYQRMTYAQRRQVHHLVAEAYSLLPQVYDFDEQISEKKLMVQWELSEQKSDSMDFKQNVSHKAKRAFIVKRLRKLLTSKDGQQSPILFEGNLSKKSEKNITWSNRFCQLTNYTFSYFYNSNIEDSSIPLGAFYYKDIQSVRAIDEPIKFSGGQQNILLIKTSQWIKRSKTLVEERRFYFATDTEEEQEQWIIYLEFLKAKATYDEFVEQFGKIPFPLQSTEKNNILLKVVRKDHNKKYSFRDDMLVKPRKLGRVSVMGQNAVQQMITINNIIVQEESVNNWQHEIQNLKPYLHEFMVKSLYVFYAHIFEVCLNPKNQQKINLGERLKIMVQHPKIFNVLVQHNHKKSSSNSEESSTISQLPIIQEDEDDSPVHKQRSQLSLPGFPDLLLRPTLKRVRTSNQANLVITQNQKK